MDHNQPSQRTFLQAFFGSFFSLSEYPQYARRSLGSALGHFVVLLTLVCSLYAGFASYWLQANVAPYLQQAVAQVPEISLKDGVASSSLAQPHIISIEETPIFILDTNNDPEVHLEKYKSIIVLSANHFTTKDSQGKIESFPLEGTFELDASKVSGWVDTLASWTLPILFLAVVAWQFCWKSVQVLFVATVVTLVNKSRPDFSTHLRLACYALSPAMGWGLLVFGAKLCGVFVPFAGIVFWVVLFGATAMAASTIRKSPRYH